MNLFKIILSITSAVIFSMIDAGFFLLGEEKLQKILRSKFSINDTVANLITGGISSALAILLFSSVKLYITRHYDIYELSIIDALGIILGTAIVIGLYLLFKKI